MKGVMIVTGGGRGIGAATARLAAARGYSVCVNYLDKAETAEALVAEIVWAGGRARAVRADVASETEVEDLFQAAETAFGPVTALVNSAGLTGHYGPLESASPVMLRQVLEVNVLGTLLCCQAAIRRMSTRQGGAGGAIVNLSSAAATLGSPATYVWYAASKGAIDSLTVGLGQELAREGVRVNAVAPGYVDTEIHAASGLPDRISQDADLLPMARAATVEEVAEPILWLLSSEASYVTGSILRVSGGR